MPGFARFSRPSAVTPATTLVPTRRTLGVAVLLSIAAHGLVAFLLARGLPMQPPLPAPERRIVLARLVEAARRPVQPATALDPPVAVPRAALPRPRPKPVRAKPIREDVPREREPAPAAPTPPASAPAEAGPVQPPARFAGLFGPVAAPAWGRSHWGTVSRPTPPPPEPDPEQQRRQARLALRMALQDRLSALTEALQRAGRQMDCDLAVDVDRRLGQVRCAAEADQALPWAHLQGLLSAGAPEAARPDLCFSLAGQQWADVACPSP